MRSPFFVVEKYRFQSYFQPLPKKKQLWKPILFILKILKTSHPIAGNRLSHPCILSSTMKPSSLMPLVRSSNESHYIRMGPLFFRSCLTVRASYIKIPCTENTLNVIIHQNILYQWLIWYCCVLLAEVGRNSYSIYRKMRQEPPNIEPCFECKHICRKLGLPV